MKSLISAFKEWWNLKQARRAAKKYSLDFEVKCVFNHQLTYKRNKNGLIEVPMQSGKTGLYSEKITMWLGDTGQKDWKFYFQGYK